MFSENNAQAAVFKVADSLDLPTGFKWNHDFVGMTPMKRWVAGWDSLGVTQVFGQSATKLDFTGVYYFKVELVLTKPGADPTKIIDASRVSDSKRISDTVDMDASTLGTPPPGYRMLRGWRGSANIGGARGEVARVFGVYGPNGSASNLIVDLFLQGRADSILNGADSTVKSRLWSSEFDKVGIEIQGNMTDTLKIPTFGFDVSEVMSAILKIDPKFNCEPSGPISPGVFFGSKLTGDQAAPGAQAVGIVSCVAPDDKHAIQQFDLAAIQFPNEQQARAAQPLALKALSQDMQKGQVTQTTQGPKGTMVAFGSTAAGFFRYDYAAPIGNNLVLWLFDTLPQANLPPTFDPFLKIVPK